MYNIEIEAQGDLKMSHSKSGKGPPKPVRDDESADREMFLAAVDAMSAQEIRKHKESKEADSGRQHLRDFKNARQARGSVKTISVDLHGLTVVEACQRVSQSIDAMRARDKGVFCLRVITGKGLHSTHGRGVLARDVYDYVKNSYHSSIESIDESPAVVQIGGVPIRGHFDVVLNFA